MAVITISRQYGSGGLQIAEKVCDVLGYSLFDKNLMVAVAQEVGGLARNEVVDFSEDTYKMRTFLERLFGSRRIKVETWSENQGGTKSLEIASLDQMEGVAVVRNTIVAAYERGNVVIVGRGGQAILREFPGVLHVRIDAPLGARALRIKEREGLSLAEASELATRKDATRDAYLQKFFDIDPGNSLLYHLILNTGKLDLDAAAQIIVNALSHLKTIEDGTA